MPEVSIITVNYNNARGLAATISSVVEQAYRDAEHVVIDGASTDESPQVLRDQGGHLAYWVSEPDRGIYHAMNKGIDRSIGRYLLFLNSGDYFHSTDALERLVEGAGDHDLVYGDLVLQAPDRRWTKRYPETLTFDHFRRDSLPHPCTLIRRSLFDDGHQYDDTLRIVSDWVFFMNAVCLRRATYRHVSHPIAVFHTDGLSWDPANRARHDQERADALARYYGAFLPDYLAFEARDAALRATLWHRLGVRLERLADRARGRSS